MKQQLVLGLFRKTVLGLILAPIALMAFVFIFVGILVIAAKTNAAVGIFLGLIFAYILYTVAKFALKSIMIGVGIEK